MPSTRLLLCVASGLLAVATLGCCSAHPPEKFAVLVSTEEANAPDTANNSEFWYDVVLMYRTLIRDGFRPENIVVLYGSGQPYQTDRHPEYNSLACEASPGISRRRTIVPLTDSDGLVGKANICNVLCCMGTGRPAGDVNGTCVCPGGGAGSSGFSCSAFAIPRLSQEDLLLIWTKGHGAAVGSAVNLGFLASGDALTDAELKTILGKLDAHRRILLFETCASGGWLDDFPNSWAENLLRRGSVTLTASGKPNGVMRWDESSYPSSYEEAAGVAGAPTPQIIHGRFTYWMNAALRSEEPNGTPSLSDADMNNLVSVLEAYDWANEQVLRENETLRLETPPGQTVQEQHPAITRRSGLSACAFVDLPEPGWYCQCLRRVPGP